MYKKISKICFLGLILMSLWSSSLCATPNPAFPFVDLTATQGTAYSSSVPAQDSLDLTSFQADGSGIVRTTISTNPNICNAIWYNVTITLAAGSNFSSYDYNTNSDVLMINKAYNTAANTYATQNVTLDGDNHYLINLSNSAAEEIGGTVYSYVYIRDVTMSYALNGDDDETDHFVETPDVFAAGTFNTVNQTSGAANPISKINISINYPHIMNFSGVSHKWGINIYRLETPASIEVIFCRVNNGTVDSVTGVSDGYVLQGTRFDYTLTPTITGIFYSYSSTTMGLDAIGERRDTDTGTALTNSVERQNWGHAYYLEYHFPAKGDDPAIIRYSDLRSAGRGTFDDQWELYFSRNQSIFSNTAPSANWASRNGG